MLGLQLARVLQQRAEHMKFYTKLPYALIRSIEDAPQVFDLSDLPKILNDFDERFPRAVNGIVANRIVACKDSGYIPCVTGDNVRDIVRATFDSADLDGTAHLFAPLVLKHVADTFHLESERNESAGGKDVWTLRPVQERGTCLDPKPTPSAVEKTFVKWLRGPIDAAGWKAQIDRIRAETDPFTKVAVADDLITDITAFACPLDTRAIVRANLTFDDLIDIALFRAYVREGIDGWTKALSPQDGLDRFQRNVFHLPEHLEKSAKTFWMQGAPLRDTLVESLNLELDTMLGVCAAIEVDAQKPLLRITLRLPPDTLNRNKRAKKHSTPFRAAASLVIEKLSTIADITQKATEGLSLSDLESMLSAHEKASLDAAITRLTASVASDNPEQGVPLDIVYVGRKRHFSTEEGVLVDLPLKRILQEVLLLRTGLFCHPTEDKGEATQLIGRVMPATTLHLAYTRAGKDLIAQQVEALR